MLWNTKSNTPKPPKLNISKLTNSKTCRDQYRIELNYRLTQIDQDNDTVCNTWTNIRSAIKNSAKASVGTIVRNKQKRTPNDTISELSKRQKDIRLQIQNTDNRERKVELKKERNRVLHTIRKIELEERNKELEAKVENISNANSDHAMFNAVKLLSQRQYENPSVEDTTGKLVTNPDQTLEIISGFFKDKFQNKDLPHITSFQGPPKKLN